MAINLTYGVHYLGIWYATNRRTFDYLAVAWRPLDWPDDEWNVQCRLRVYEFESDGTRSIETAKRDKKRWHEIARFKGNEKQMRFQISDFIINNYYEESKSIAHTKNIDLIDHQYTSINGDYVKMLSALAKHESTQFDLTFKEQGINNECR